MADIGDGPKAPANEPAISAGSQHHLPAGHEVMRLLPESGVEFWRAA